MTAISTTMDDFYEAALNRVSRALDEHQVTTVEDIALWTDVLQNVHTIEAERDPRRVGGLALKLSEVGVRAASDAHTSPQAFHQLAAAMASLDNLLWATAGDVS